MTFDSEEIKKMLKPIVVKSKFDPDLLEQLLAEKYKKNFFCFHKWVYYRFIFSNRIHKVCTKCYKKK